MIKNLISASLLLALCGCSFIQPKQQISIEEKQNLIFGSTRAATVIAFNEIRTNNKKEVASKILENVDKYVWPALNSKEPVSSQLEKSLVETIPTEYRSYFQLAMNTFHTYYDVSLDPKIESFLTSDQALLFKAFVGGLRAGITDFINFPQ